MKLFRKNKLDYLAAVEKQPAEQLAEIGTLLRSKRQELNLSLDEVVAKTRIHRRFLQALEEGRLNELPEPIYTKSFIKQYAGILGLNGQELFDSFPNSYSRSQMNISGRNLPRAKSLPIHLYFLYILAVFCIVNGLSFLLNRFEVRNTSSQSNEQQTPPQPSP